MGTFAKKVTGRRLHHRFDHRCVCVANTRAAGVKKAKISRGSLFLSDDAVRGSGVLLRSVTFLVLGEDLSSPSPLTAVKRE